MNSRSQARWSYSAPASERTVLGKAGQSGSLPLGVLLRREQRRGQDERYGGGLPEIVAGQASQSRKGEDFTLLKPECQLVPGDPLSTFSVFVLFDGHNGSAAALYSKEHLLNNILNAIPSDLSRDEWIAVLPRALVAGFIKTDKDFQEKAYTSGTTVTFVIIYGWIVTVASVGDSHCVLQSAEGSVHSLSADHRLEVNKQEVERVTASGGEVGRLNTGSGIEVGPLRCWPGGLCLSRSIGDMDVGEFIIPIPYVKQVKLSSAGGRLIISSDGVWDSLSPEEALNCSSHLPPEGAASTIVNHAVRVKGLRDDTTCIVVDILPPEKIIPTVPLPKRPVKSVLKNIFGKKPSEPSSHSCRKYHQKEYIGPDLVEEIFEDGSAILSQRLGVEYPLRNMFKLCACAVCQLEMRPGEGISVHVDPSRCSRLYPWDGPFLCSSCQAKREAMEGKKPFRGSTPRPAIKGE